LQLRVKVEIVTDALFRIAHLSQVPISIGQELPSTRYRTTLRCAVTAHASEARPALEISHAGQIDAVAQVGAVGFRKRQSHEVHPVASCLVAHPLIEELMQAGNFAGATEVTFRVGARTAERMVIVAGQAKPNKAFGLPEDVRVVAQEALSGGAQAWIHEHVAGHRFRISARSFFQARPDGAEALIAAVARAVAPFDAVSDRLVDLYGGVGLFTAGLSAQRAVLVERSESSISDARINLADLGTKIFSGSVERWKPVAADVVVADPARAGLNVSGVAAISATGAERVALVSCDPASLARDLALFVQAGFEVGGVELVDMFPQTHHIETVATLRRVSASKVAE
jgi:23S rRNA (uracil1939-C5)-methyltransferase